MDDRKQFQPLSLNGRQVARVSTLYGQSFYLFMSADEFRQQQKSGVIVADNVISRSPEGLPMRVVARVEWGFDNVEISQIKEADRRGMFAQQAIMHPGMAPGSPLLRQ